MALLLLYFTKLFTTCPSHPLFELKSSTSQLRNCLGSCPTAGQNPGSCETAINRFKLSL